MRGFVQVIAGLVLFGAAGVSAQEKPNLSGTWKLNDVVLTIDEQGENIHINEARGPNPKDNVSNFACSTTGGDCQMQDGTEKAKVSVYYNGPALVVIKTHGRKGDTVDKRRFSLSPDGNSLLVEVMHIVPDGQPEKLVFTKLPVSK